MGTNFSKRGVGQHSSVVMAGHHSGVMSGHEVMAYAFLSGTMCRPKRKRPMLLRSNSVEVKLDVRMLSRSPSPPTRTRKMPTFVVDDDTSSHSNQHSNIEIDLSSVEVDSEVSLAASDAEQ